MLYHSKMEEFADNSKKKMNSEFKLVLGRVENILGKEQKACLQAFSPFPTMFSEVPFLGVVKNSRLCGKGLNRIMNWHSELL